VSHHDGKLGRARCKAERERRRKEAEERAAACAALCRELQRDLNPEYAAMAEKRIAGATFREGTRAPQGQATLPWLEGSR